MAAAHSNEQPYLDDRHFWLETRRQLSQHLANQALVVQDLSHFHDAHDGRLNQQLPVFFDMLVGGLLLDLQLGLQRYVDVDAEFFAIQKGKWFIDQQWANWVSGDIGSLRWRLHLCYLLFVV